MRASHVCPLLFLLTGVVADTGWALQLPGLPPASMPYLLGAQSTVVWQYHPPFSSPYEGPHSLRGHAQDAISHSYTLYTGARLLPWLDVYLNPEMIRGGGISDGFGLAGYTNGEVIRNPSAGQSPYLARAFVRATLPLGHTVESVGTEYYQIAGLRPEQRLVLTAGILAVTDIFDVNRYANNTRTQFLNWALINNSAYDFAADTRGYSRGFALEWSNGPLTVRGGMFQMPTTANGLNLDDEVIQSHGDQIEVEFRRALVAEQVTVVRLLGYHNQASMGNYRNALALGAQTASPPDITQTRHRGAEKWGTGINIEQPLSPGGDSGLFARLGWNDGATESFAFTEAERSLTAGAQLAGGAWRRDDDRVGLAVALNEIDSAHAEYLRAGGLGFILGDGRLRHGPETLVETYYLLQVFGWLALTVDYQFIADPGYNRDRGPVSVISIRTHLELLSSSPQPQGCHGGVFGVSCHSGRSTE